MSLSAPHLTQTHVCSPATLCASGISGCTRRGCGAGPASQIEAFIQLGGGSGGSMSGHSGGHPSGPLCHHGGDSRDGPWHRVCPWAPASPTGSEDTMSRAALAKATNPGKNGSGNTGNSKELYPEYTEGVFLKKFSQKFSFKRSKSCKCPVSWNLMVQETEFTPFGHPPSLPFACSLDMRQHDKIF